MYILDIEEFKKARISLTLIVLNIICFILFNFLLDPQYFYILAQFNYAILEYNEYWRLFTPMFLHADIMHLFSNMIGLLLFGTVVEHNYSKIEYFLIYFVSGFLGNLFTLLLYPPFTLSVGASGAIFGLMGATVILFLFEENKSLLLFGLAYIGLFLYSSLQPGINAWAHLFGLLGGVGFGFLLTYRRVKKDRATSEDYYH